MITAAVVDVVVGKGGGRSGALGLEGYLGKYMTRGEIIRLSLSIQAFRKVVGALAQKVALLSSELDTVVKYNRF